MTISPPLPPLNDNDQIDDCTSVGLANSAQTLASLNGFSLNTPTVSAIRFYERSTGYVPRSAATDQGGVETDVLTYAGEHGQTLYPLIPVTSTLFALRLLRLALSILA
nr:hypothetical protein [uncultured Neokomagataea sp.]